MDTLTVKQALIAIANEEKKPPYGMCVVRDVVTAFRENKEHHLKDKILARSPFFAQKNKGAEVVVKAKTERTRYIATKELSENNKWLNELCEPKGMTTIISELLGFSSGFFTDYKNGRRAFPDHLKNQVKKIESQAKEILAEREKAYQLKIAHGTATRYAKGCRCDLCRRASSKRRAGLKRMAV
ncbi:hypothetical protein DJ533_00130 (plasmid) [Acinetobacter defluvii]|uniref:Uncharacterized protein n=1 Tax=Acinetobacter defluvii TaxID=1871111 RepID=A0A2S2F814_9GAMM|nr:hypothetical protein [Acinetobacter defluvii]AWL27126.1 hypothetical protein DJ533_00130 [Acinetobacter defluvii]